MRRVVSLYLPTWPTDRIRRRTGEPPRHEPLVTVHTVGSRRVVRAACAAAQEAGLGFSLGSVVPYARMLGKLGALLYAENHGQSDSKQRCGRQAD
jgi:hypothetical protein